MKQTGAKGSYAAPAIERAFEIIEALASYPEGALVSEIAATLDRTLGELFRFFVVMERLGYVRKSETTDRYTVAYKLLELAYRATPAQDIVRTALPEMQGLASAAGQSCHLVVPNAGSGLVVACEQQPGTRGFRCVSVRRSTSSTVAPDKCCLPFRAPRGRSRSSPRRKRSARPRWIAHGWASGWRSSANVAMTAVKARSPMALRT
jgi:DNA-binding IclR family transcriptional regulator